MCDRAKLAKNYISNHYVQPYAIYQDSMKQDYEEECLVMINLDQAMERHEFQVYYQPIYEAKTGKIVAAEALVDSGAGQDGIAWALYGGADLLIVGRFADTVDVSGVATGSMLLSTVTNIITGLSMGITIAVAEKIGLKKERDAGKAIAYRSHCLPDQHCRRPSSGGRVSYGSRWCRNSHGAGPGG